MHRGATPDGGEPPVLAGRGAGARVWLVRHGEVEERWQGRAYGDLDVPLSELGARQTEELARAFAAEPLRAVYASPLARANLLGRALAAACGVELFVADGLRELHRGRWQGERLEDLSAARADEVAAYYADPWSFEGHGGECDARIFARAEPVLQAALACAAGGAVALATHYNVIRVLVARALGMAPERSFALRVDPGCAVLLVDAKARFLLCHANVRDPSAARPEGSTIQEGMGRA